MKQIYKNLYQDDEGRYIFANENDTHYVVEQQSYILIYILECLQELKNQEYKLDNGTPKVPN